MLTAAWNLLKGSYGLNDVEITTWWTDGTLYIQARDAATNRHITTYSAEFSISNNSSQD